MRTIMAVAIAALTSSCAIAGDFWSVPRGGANSFNHVETVQHLADAKEFGAGFVRVAIDKWKGKGRDFLAGDLDHYAGLVPEDVAQLRTLLDGAAEKKVPILLTALGVPGDRWVQNNGNEQDTHLWQDKAWWDAAARYWGDIARTFKGHPGIAGYNILNEPVPEWKAGLDDANEPAKRDAWCAKVKGTARDINGVYRKIVAAIRAEDKDVPIVLDTGSWARPLAIRCLEPIDDPHVLYAVHMYDPWEYTTAPAIDGKWPKLSYPGPMTLYGTTRDWNGATIAGLFTPLLEWADAHHIAHDRLLLGEFGCWRRGDGCADYLRDVLAAATTARMHWAFYAFREDGWDVMDYELGTGPTPPKYWTGPLKGSDPALPRPSNAMSEVLKAALAKMDRS